MSDDPYAPPTEKSIPQVERVGDPDELATRWSRFLAFLIDMAIILAIFIPVGIIVGLSGLLSLEESSRFEDIAFESFAMLVFLAINYHLLVARGQTIGKWILGIQAVDRATGRLMPMRRVVLVRNLWYLPFAAIGYLMSSEWADLFGGAVFLVDAFAIFTPSRRCLHDYFAGSNVVRFDPQRGRLEVAGTY